MKYLASATLCALFVLGCSDDPYAVNDARITDAVEDAARPDSDKERDVYRRPAQTLSFCGVEPGMVVTELWPGGGWYTRILSLLLGNNGTLLAAQFERAQTREFFVKVRESYEAMVKESGYDNVHIVELGSNVQQLGPAESVDVIVTFRNLHNWIQYGYFEDVVAAAHRALKPGGVFCVIEHRGDDHVTPQELVEYASTTGYVPEWYAKVTIGDAGFSLVESTDLNRNLKDTHDHPAGVWSLPPTLRDVSEEDVPAYLTIGESDRMTLKFVKDQDQ